MKIVYTHHAQKKFIEETYVKQLKITKLKVSRVIRKPFLEDKTRGEKITSIGKIDKNHSLIVVYKTVGAVIKIITFYPAKGGRYESKILQN